MEIKKGYQIVYEIDKTIIADVDEDELDFAQLALKQGAVSSITVNGPDEKPLYRWTRKVLS